MLDFSTFDAYCQEKWGFKKANANFLIQGAEVSGLLPEKSANMLANPRQAAALASVPEPDREKVLESAKAKADEEKRPMTAADIKAQWDAANPLHQPLQRLIILRFQFLRSGG